MDVFFFFFKQKTAYDKRISDWSSDVCSSDLYGAGYRRTDLERISCRRIIGSRPGAKIADQPVKIEPCREPWIGAHAFQFGSQNIAFGSHAQSSEERRVG